STNTLNGYRVPSATIPVSSSRMNTVSPSSSSHRSPGFGGSSSLSTSTPAPNRTRWIRPESSWTSQTSETEVGTNVPVITTLYLIPGFLFPQGDRFREVNPPGTLVLYF